MSKQLPKFKVGDYVIPHRIAPEVAGHDRGGKHLVLRYFAYDNGWAYEILRDEASFSRYYAEDQLRLAEREKPRMEPSEY